MKLRASKITTLIALTLLVSQGIGAAHVALVKHGFCAEHGDITELSSAPEHQHPATAQRGNSTSGDCENGLTSLEQDEHSHCAVQAHRRSENVAPLFAVGALVHLSELRIVVPRTQMVDARIAELRLAPKQSPPV